MKLLTVNNAKTIKGEELGYLTGVLYLAPADLSGFNVCPFAEMAGCKAGCLNTAGRGGIAPGSAKIAAPNGELIPDNTVQRARIERTRFYFGDRQAFTDQLLMEIAKLARKASRKGMKVAIRLNGTSDIAWERQSLWVSPELMQKLRKITPPGLLHELAAGADPKTGEYGYVSILDVFPGIQFYDYTKTALRVMKKLPRNYHLTLSYSGATMEYQEIIANVLNKAHGTVNVAVVTPSAPADLGALKLHGWKKHMPTVDGDQHDLRFLDGEGVAVLLRPKGPARKDTSGFVFRL